MDNAAASGNDANFVNPAASNGAKGEAAAAAAASAVALGPGALTGDAAAAAQTPAAKANGKKGAKAAANN